MIGSFLQPCMYDFYVSLEKISFVEFSSNKSKYNKRRPKLNVVNI